MQIKCIFQKIGSIAVGLSLFAVPSIVSAQNIEIEQLFEENSVANHYIHSDPIYDLIMSNPSYYLGSSSVDYSPAIAHLTLNSKYALVMNSRTGQILYQKNIHSVRPIASISKLMSAMVLLDANLNMNQLITITDDEIDYKKKTSSRLSVGTTLSRETLLHIGLMSSENRAIHALGRTYPGGMTAFVDAMNRKARSLGMMNTKFYEPTGLDPRNVSTASDLVKLVNAANQYPKIRRNSVSTYGTAYTSAGLNQSYKNSNVLIREGDWDIDLQKTGYIRESGYSMVLKTTISNQPVTIILLNASSSNTRANDAKMVRYWIQGNS